MLTMCSFSFQISTYYKHINNYNVNSSEVRVTPLSGHQKSTAVVNSVAIDAI